MKKVFLDSDIILDALLKRPGFDLPAINLLALASQSDITAVTSSITFMNVHYFLDKFDRPRKIDLLKTLRSIVNVIEIGEDIIDFALNSNFPDFEDAVQYYAAISAKADVIITRNIKDYKQSSIPVLTAEQFFEDTIMQDKINQYTTEINAFSPANSDELETFRIKYLGTKGIIKDLFEQFKSTTPEEKRVLGKVLNEFKQLAEAKYQELKESQESGVKSQDTDIDLTLPGEGFNIGSRHPLSLTRIEIIDIFKRLGFVVAEGPEIEDDWHNFSALNFPEEHPARDMQDTFFIKKNSGQDDIALRTHTSSVQVRMMESGKPPFRAIMPGRVYRNEAISARAHCFFHQVEGLYVDENVSFADLKQTLYHFVQELYGEGTKVRFRPSYFPFTEPSAEMDVSCTICKGSGCNMCKYSGWVEILGCGMVDPNVLENCGIDSKKYTGFAFGMGIERITNLKYVIRDLRLFSENDVRFLKQFQTEII